MLANGTLPTADCIGRHIDTMPQKHRPLMETAYTELKQRIITLELKPGERLDDYQLSRGLKVSRTPVREAIFLLVAEGLVDIRAKAGFFVRPLDLLDIAHLFEAHIVLAKAFARLAATRVTPAELDTMAEKAAEVETHIAHRDYLAITRSNGELHRLEAAATHNQIIRKMADSVHDQGERLAYLCFGGGDQEPPDLGDHFDQVIGHHSAMLDALGRSDAAAAERIAAEHVQLFKVRVQQYLDSDAIAGFEITDGDLASVSFDGSAGSAAASPSSAKVPMP